MRSITIDKRFRGPPHSANGGYVCGLLSSAMGGSAEVTTGFAAIAAEHFGMKGNEPILLGRMTAEIRNAPKPGDRCVLVAWPTGRDGRKLFAKSALLSGGEVLATAQATWLLVDRQVQLGQTSDA